MSAFDPDRYGEAASRLIRKAPPWELGPGEPNEAARTELDRLDAGQLFAGRDVIDEDLAACCLSGLWLLHHFLDRSHQISQNIDAAEGSYWHGIMHRREPDFSNAKYWFRRVGQHAVYDSLAEELQAATPQASDEPARTLAASRSWDPLRFVDACEAVYFGKSRSKEFCLHLGRREWQLLFDYCYRGATGVRL